MNTRYDKSVDKKTELTTQKHSVITHSQSELYMALKQWHQGAVANLNTIHDHKDADLDFGSGIEIKAGTDKAKGFHAGIMIALHYLGNFPDFQFSDGFAEDGDDGDN